MPIRKAMGIESISRCRIANHVITMLKPPDRITAAIAAGSGSPKVKHTYETKKVVMDGAGATAKGIFAMNPIRRVETEAEITVAQNAWLISTPGIFASRTGLTMNMYESVR